MPTHVNKRDNKQSKLEIRETITGLFVNLFLSGVVGNLCRPRGLISIPLFIFFHLLDQPLTKRAALTGRGDSSEDVASWFWADQGVRCDSEGVGALIGVTRAS